MVEDLHHQYQRHNQEHRHHTLEVLCLLLGVEGGADAGIERSVEQEAEDEVDNEEKQKLGRDCRQLHAADADCRDCTGGRDRCHQRRPDQELGKTDRTDTEDLAEHQLEWLDGRNYHFDNVRALLFEDAAHDVDAVHQHRHVDDHHEDVGEHEGLALVRGLLAALAELEGVEPDPAGELAHRLGVEAGVGQPVGNHDVVDRSLNDS